MLSQAGFTLPKFFLWRMLGFFAVAPSVVRLATHAERAENARLGELSRARDATAQAAADAWAKNIGWRK